MTGKRKYKQRKNPELSRAIALPAAISSMESQQRGILRRAEEYQAEVARKEAAQSKLAGSFTAIYRRYQKGTGVEGPVHLYDSPIWFSWLFTPPIPLECMWVVGWRQEAKDQMYCTGFYGLLGWFQITVDAHGCVTI